LLINYIKSFRAPVAYATGALLDLLWANHMVTDVLRQRGDRPPYVVFRRWGYRNPIVTDPLDDDVVSIDLDGANHIRVDSLLVVTRSLHDAKEDHIIFAFQRATHENRACFRSVRRFIELSANFLHESNTALVFFVLSRPSDSFCPRRGPHSPKQKSDREYRSIPHNTPSLCEMNISKLYLQSYHLHRKCQCFFLKKPYFC